MMRLANQSLPMAVALLLGTYYVFNIEYQAGGSNVFVFLEAVLLGKDKEAKKRISVQNFLNSLV